MDGSFRQQISSQCKMGIYIYRTEPMTNKLGFIKTWPQQKCVFEAIQSSYWTVVIQKKRRRITFVLHEICMWWKSPLVCIRFPNHEQESDYGNDTYLGGWRNGFPLCFCKCASMYSPHNIIYKCHMKTKLKARQAVNTVRGNFSEQNSTHCNIIWDMALRVRVCVCEGYKRRPIYHTALRPIYGFLIHLHRLDGTYIQSHSYILHCRNESFNLRAFQA